MSLIGRLFGTSAVEIPEGAYDSQGAAHGTAFSDFSHGEIAEQLDCCEDPDPYTETCELPRSEMYYGGVCRCCGERYEGIISIDVYVE